MEYNGESIVFTKTGRDVWDGMSEESQRGFVSCMGQMLYMVGKVDPTSSLMARIDDIERVVREGSTPLDLQRRMDDLKDAIRGVDVSHQISSLRLFIESKLSTSIQDKGKQGEQEVLSVLEDVLLSSDGYSIEDVSGIAGNCDILVKRTCHPDVRIDVKNWSGKVGQRDVDKFVKDITTLNTSGILVSLKSGVVGKRPIELEQMSNGKFAVYLSNVGDDLSVVAEYIRLLYTLEAVCNTGSDMIRLNKHSVMMIESYVKDSKDKVLKIKQNLQSSIALLGELRYDKVLEIIKGGGDTSPGIVPAVVSSMSTTIKCKSCGKSFVNLTGLKTHMKTSKCKEITGVPEV